MPALRGEEQAVMPALRGEEQAVMPAPANEALRISHLAPPRLPRAVALIADSLHATGSNPNRYGFTV